MRTEAEYKSTITMSDITALLHKKLEETYDVDLDLSDIDIEYDQDSNTFSVTVNCVWDTDLTDSDDDGSGDWHTLKEMMPEIGTTIEVELASGETVVARVEELDVGESLSVYLDGAPGSSNTSTWWVGDHKHNDDNENVVRWRLREDD